MEMNLATARSGSLGSSSSASLPSTSGSEPSLACTMVQHLITYKPFSPGFCDIPSIIYSAGVEPIVKKMSMKSGKEVFVNKLKLANIRKDYASYMVRCSDEQKIVILPSPIGLIGPEAEVVVHICSNPKSDLSIEEYGGLWIQVLSCTVNVNWASHRLNELDYWKSLADLWGAQRLGLTFPRMEVQVFGIDGGIGGGTGDTEFLAASLDTLAGKVNRMTTAHRALKDLNRFVAMCTGAGVVLIAGWLLHMVAC